MLPELSVTAYQSTSSVLYMTIVVMLGSSLLFVLLRGLVSRGYQLAVSLMAAVVFMAACYYLRIYFNWEAAYALKASVYAPSGVPLNYALRYLDWIVNVPLILSAVALVLDLGAAKSRSLVTRLVAAAVIMIATGFVGETSADAAGRTIWGLVAMLPFVYIIYVLYSELNGALRFESSTVLGLFGRLRWLLLLSWSFYPVVYSFPIFNLSGPAVTIGVQIGNSIADLGAKALFGLLIFAIARQKSEEGLKASRDESLQQQAAVKITQPVSTFPQR